MTLRLNERYNAEATISLPAGVGARYVPEKRQLVLWAESGASSAAAVAALDAVATRLAASLIRVNPPTPDEGSADD